MSHLLKIDELVLDQHSRLSADDDCYYLMEYTARMGFGYSTANDWIQNLKKPMDRKGLAEWKWKGVAIRHIGTALQEGMAAVVDFATTILVPVPPSKIAGDPGHDDRVMQLLRLACPAGADIRELLQCRKNRAAAHGTDQRPTVQELISNYQFNETLALPARPNFVVFDDMITTGTSFAACKHMLQQRYGAKISVTGIFASRRILPPAALDFEGIVVGG